MKIIKRDLKSESNVHYKAGDFTSGKMGEIFKKCHHSLDLVYIDHKQFGSANLVPEEYIAFIVCRAVGLNEKFKKFYFEEYSGTGLEFVDLNYEMAFNVVNDFLCDGFASWFDMMTGLLLAWSYPHDQDMQDIETDL